MKVASSFSVFGPGKKTRVWVFRPGGDQSKRPAGGRPGWEWGGGWVVGAPGPLAARLPRGPGRGGRRRLDQPGAGLRQGDAAGPRQGLHASAGRAGELIGTGARGSRRHEVSFNVVLLARGKQALPWPPRRRRGEQKGCVVCVFRAGRQRSVNGRS